MGVPRIRPALTTPIIRALCLAIALFTIPASVGGGVEDIPQEVLDGKARIERPLPDQKGGQAYRLIYAVNVPVAVYWRFKTDFDNTFVITHRFITSHRVVRRTGNVVVTENTYHSHGDRVFRWKTTIHPDTRRLEYVLLNPRSVEHRFHHGSIDVLSVNGQTLVVQTAYFSFFGASLWANLPVLGGMRSSLNYTARWERETVERLKDYYSSTHPDQPTSKGAEPVSD